YDFCIICAYPTDLNQAEHLLRVRFFASPDPNHQLSTKKERKNDMNPLIQFKTTTAVFIGVLVLGCCALLPTAQAVSPPPDGCYPAFTTAEGCDALNLLTTGEANTGWGGVRSSQWVPAISIPLLALERWFSTSRIQIQLLALWRVCSIRQALETRPMELRHLSLTGLAATTRPLGPSRLQTTLTTTTPRSALRR